MVIRDRPFVRLALTTIAVIAVGWGVFSWIVPTYARDQIGVGLRLIGLMAMANAVTVVLAQIPVAKLAEGRRRTVTMAIGSLALAVARLLALGAEFVAFDYAYVALVGAAIVVGVGELFPTAVLSPLGSADLAPPGHCGAATWRRSASPGGSAWRWRRPRAHTPAERVACGDHAGRRRRRAGGGSLSAGARTRPPVRGSPDPTPHRVPRSASPSTGRSATPEEGRAESSLTNPGRRSRRVHGARPGSEVLNANTRSEHPAVGEG